MQGLQNLGATCAINSLIQIICRNSHLRNNILSSDVLSDTLTHELKEILDLMHNQNHSLSPKKFVNHLYQHLGAYFSRGEQLDICELWMFLFHKIATELGKDVEYIIQNNEHKFATYTDNNSLATNMNLHYYCQQTMCKINNNKTSNWLDSSQGIMLSILSCDKCQNAIYNFEPFITIPLDIPEELEKESIANMFRNYLKSQNCQGDWKCETCNEYTHYNKSLKIWKLPPVLIFVVKRFNNMHSKNTKPISMNKRLCVKRGSIIADINDEYTYHFTSAALHFGSLFGGHYCALCKLDDKYVIYDDLNMSIVNDDNMDKIYNGNSDAYMIVYSK